MDSMYHHPMDTRGMGGGSINGKGLMVSISEDHRSISPSPQPGSVPMAMMGSSSSSMMMGGGGGMGTAGMGGNGGGGDDSPYLQEDSSGEGEQPSQFGRAKKPKRKAAPRTSRACLACRRQKMRCEGAENPPCRRCVQNEVDCMFERRSDYLLNPEDRAWQNGVEKRLEHLSRTIDMILAHLGGGPAALPPMPTTATAFPEMPPAAGYFESYERHGVPQTAPPVGPGGPGAGGPGSQGDGRINYVVPSPAETAAIAAQARMKRGRGNTMPSPSNMPSAGFGPETAFQLFSPRTAALDANGGLPNPYSFGGPPMPNSAHPHQHPHMQGQQHDHSHLHGHAHHGHPHELGGHHGGSHTPGPPPGSSAGPVGLQYSHAYSFDTAYPGPSPALGGPAYSNGPGQAGVQGGSGTPSGSMSGPSGSGAGLVGSSSDLVPRSLGSPAVRFAHQQDLINAHTGDLHDPHHDSAAQSLQGTEVA